VASVAEKYETWVDLAWDYLHGPPAALPQAQIWAAVEDTFTINAVSWNWKNHDETFGVEVSHAELLPPAADLPFLADLMRVHPLVEWFETTHDPKPMTEGRIPHTMLSPAGHAMLVELLGPHGLEQQLSIPYELDGNSHRAFVMARPAEDFTDEEVELACRIQPLLTLVGRQASLLENPRSNLEGGLTGRELCILRLLADGGTTQRIAHTLGISPRTVDTHLAHIYRKLDVDGRVRAITEGQRLGLVPR
jgi:DNA-binding CsgD family transcriptional regulator